MSALQAIRLLEVLAVHQVKTQEIEDIQLAQYVFKDLDKLPASLLTRFLDALVHLGITDPIGINRILCRFEEVTTAARRLPPPEDVVTLLNACFLSGSVSQSVWGKEHVSVVGYHYYCLCIRTEGGLPMTSALK